MLLPLLQKLSLMPLSLLIKLLLEPLHFATPGDQDGLAHQKMNSVAFVVLHPGDHPSPALECNCLLESLNRAVEDRSWRVFCGLWSLGRFSLQFSATDLRNELEFTCSCHCPEIIDGSLGWQIMPPNLIDGHALWASQELFHPLGLVSFDDPGVAARDRHVLDLRLSVKDAKHASRLFINELVRQALTEVERNLTVSQEPENFLWILSMLHGHVSLEVVPSTKLAADGAELVNVSIKKRFNCGSLEPCDFLTDYQSRPQRECTRHRDVRLSKPQPLSIAYSGSGPCL